MICEYCRQNLHHPHCPLAPEPKSKYCCSICGNGIFNGEEYIVNNNDDYAHWECVDYAKDLAKFLGYEIKEMEDENW